MNKDYRSSAYFVKQICENCSVFLTLEVGLMTHLFSHPTIGDRQGV